MAQQMRELPFLESAERKEVPGHRAGEWVYVVGICGAFPSDGVCVFLSNRKHRR